MFRLACFTTSLFALFACSSSTATDGQHITCETDPETGAILLCQPSDEDDDDDGADECQDVDEDGDGMPQDSGPITKRVPTAGDDDDGDCGCDGDEDDDGVPDDDDCDQQPGGDDDDSDLPYNFDMPLGGTFRPIIDAFTEKGAPPQEILSIEMEDGGPGWRLAELQAGSEITVTEADCDHVGNRDVGRDRVIVSWRKTDGSTETDHMTLRYCED